MVPVLFDHELGKFHLLNLTSSEEGKKVERKEGRKGGGMAVMEGRGRGREQGRTEGRVEGRGE